MDRKIRVGSVSYLNAKPLLFGLNASGLEDKIVLIEEYPSKIASRLLNDEIDIGLVPVEVILHLKESHINTNYCIGCDGPVASVCIFSDVPLSEVDTILLDYQSRTSVALAKILLKDFWKLSPTLIEADIDYRSKIKGKVAGLVIGDRALQQRKMSKYIYDLGKGWKSFTGLPFVFAAWISNKKLDKSFVDLFDEATGRGVSRIEDVLENISFEPFDLRAYYTKYISYTLDDAKKEGLAKFLELLRGVVK